MNDTSTNAVQNKVIKSYADSLIPQYLTKRNSAIIARFQCSSSSRTITLNNVPSSMVINWGDGTITTGTNSHTYSSAGDYTAIIETNVGYQQMFKNCSQLREVELPEFSDYTIPSEMFSGCTNLKKVTTPYNDLGTNAFYDCTVYVVDFKEVMSAWYEIVDNAQSGNDGFLNAEVFFAYDGKSAVYRHTITITVNSLVFTVPIYSPSATPLNFQQVCGAGINNVVGWYRPNSGTQVPVHIRNISFYSAPTTGKITYVLSGAAYNATATTTNFAASNFSDSVDNMI